MKGERLLNSFIQGGGGLIDIFVIPNSDKSISELKENIAKTKGITYKELLVIKEKK